MNFNATSSHWTWVGPFVCICALSVGAACGGNGDDGVGGAGAGNGLGGNVTSCVETVDGAMVVENGTTSHIVRAADGYMLAVLAGGEVSVVALDEHAAVLRSTQVSSASGKARLPSVSASANGFVALWAEGSSIFTRPLDADGKPSGAEVMIATVAASEPRPASASTGSAVAATWIEGGTSIAGILSGAGLSQSTSLPGLFPAIAASDGTVAVAWSDAGAGGPVRVAALGAVGAAVAVPGSAALIKSLTGMDGDFLVAWEDVGGDDEQVRLARVDVSGSVIANATASPEEGSSNWPATAWSGERLAVAYYQYRTGSPSVVVTFLDGSLNPIDNEVVIDDGKYPSAVWGPSSLAVVYTSAAGPVKVSLVTCP